MSFILKYLRNRNLRFDILTSFFVIQILTASSIIYYTYRSNSETVVEFSDKTMEELSTSKIDRISSRFDAVQTAVHMGSYIIREPDGVGLNNKILLDYCIAVVRLYRFLESIFIGTENGIFFQVKVLPPNSTYRSSDSKFLPKKASIAVRIVDRTHVPATETWSYLDDEGRRLETEELPEFQVTFDHKVRPWYQKAMQTRSQVWSDIYIFSTTRLPGVATSYPLQNSEGHYFGVIGSDVPLDSFTQILKNDTFEGLSMVITKNGEIVATPFDDQPVRKELPSEEAKLKTLRDLQNALPATAYELYRDKDLDRKSAGQIRFNFKYEGKQYIAFFKPYDQKLFKNWLYMFIMPMDALTGKIRATQQKTLLISFVILILSIMFITYLAHRIARPIILLSDQANRITRFDLSEPKNVKSDIREIQLLQNSISSMRRSLASFGKFVPKMLVKKLIDKGTEVKIGGKSRKLTILFSDIANFTGISETYPPDKLALHLSEYFEEMTEVINTENGTIDKYIGDAIMAFWGAPNTDKDHALHACKSALLCQRRLVDLNRKWNFEKKPQLNTRIGLHTGEVIVGNIGSTERMNYTILGDAVNLASRLEGANKFYHSHVIISEDVLHDIRDQAVVRPLDIVAVKGKAQGILIFELVALKNSDPLLIPTDEQVEFCRLFERAVNLYREQRWDEAITAFERIIHNYGKEYVCDMYIKRCTAFKQTPPGPDWDGVFHMEMK